MDKEQRLQAQALAFIIASLAVLTQVTSYNGLWLISVGCLLIAGLLFLASRVHTRRK